MSKRVLLTGAGGFIGAHTLEYFLDKTNWEIIVIDSFRHKGTYSRLNEVKNFDANRVKVLNYDLSTPISPQLEAQIMDRQLVGGQIFDKSLDYVFNIASDSAVERSVTDPVQCWDNNTKLVVNMLEFARRVEPRLFLHVSTDEVYGDCPQGYSHKEWDMIIPSNPYAASKAAQEALCISYWRTYDLPIVLTNCANCHDLQTQAMTPDGPKSVDDIREGDLVFALREGVMVAEAVQKVIRKEYQGEMVRIEHQKVDQLVTPDHRCMVSLPVGKPRRYGDHVYVPANTLAGLARFRVPLTGQWIAPYTEKIRTMEITGNKDYHPNTVRLPDEVNNKWLARICGWYVSEGSIAPGFITFPQRKNLHKQSIATLLKDGGLRATVTEEGVTTSSGELADILSQFGRHSHVKKLPYWLKCQDRSVLHAFWETAMQGDGSFILNRSGTLQPVYYTFSKALAYDMAEIGMKIGFACRVSESHTRNYNGDPCINYIVRFRRTVSDVESRNVHTEQYTGEVWCLTVPSGNFAVVRNGVISFSGNCVGEWQDKEKFLPKLIWKIATDQEMEIYGDTVFCPVTSQPINRIGSRYYIHAKNHADAMLFVAGQRVPRYSSEDKLPGRWNISGNTELNNLEIAQLVARLMGKELKYRLVSSQSARKGYDRRYALDVTKLSDAGWVPPLSFEASLKSIIDWTLANPHWL